MGLAGGPFNSLRKQTPIRLLNRSALGQAQHLSYALSTEIFIIISSLTVKLLRTSFTFRNAGGHFCFLFDLLMSNNCVGLRELCSVRSLPRSLHSSPSGGVIIPALQVEVMDSDRREARCARFLLPFPLILTSL